MDSKNTATIVKTQTTSGSTAKPAPSESEIAARAYELFLSRGATHGYDLGDWLQAERELTAGMTSTTKARTASA